MLTKIKKPSDIPTEPHYAVLDFCSYDDDMPYINHYVTSGLDEVSLKIDLAEMLGYSDGNDILVLKVMYARIPTIEMQVQIMFDAPIQKPSFTLAQVLNNATTMQQFPKEGYYCILTFTCYEYDRSFPYTAHYVTTDEQDLMTNLQKLYDEKPNREDIIVMHVESVGTVQNSSKINFK